MSVDGQWSLNIKSPMGPMESLLSLKTEGGAITGVQTAQGQSSEVFEARFEGGVLSWINAIKTPMPMKLEFSGDVDGDSISGKVKAGMMGSMSFTGARKTGAAEAPAPARPEPQTHGSLADDPSNSGARVLNTDPLFGEVMAFLTDEADMLDDDQYLAWLELLTPDIRYEMPGRRTVHRKDGKGYDMSSAYYGDNLGTLTMRARQNVEAPSAWYREPATRTHRIISNLVVRTTDVEDEIYAKSSIILMANRFDQDVVDILAAKRRDILRRTEGGLKIAKRTILIDQALLAQPFGNLFL